MVKKRCGDPAGFAEGAPVRAHARRAAPIDIQALFDAILAKRRRAEDLARAAVRQAEAEHRTAEAVRAARFNGWIKARTHLRAAVVEVEAVLLPLGLYLGMADEGAHPVNLAAVEIRLYVYGRPCEVSLDITVNEEGRQTACDVGGSGPAHRTPLPDVSRATADHYRTAVLAYVERALPSEAAIAGPPCRLCGRRVHEGDQL